MLSVKKKEEKKIWKEKKKGKKKARDVHESFTFKFQSVLELKKIIKHKVYKQIR